MTSLIHICNTIVHWMTDETLRDPGWSPETWETFCRVAQIHGVSALLQPKLALAPWLPVDCRAWLNQQHTLNTQRIERMQAELRAILACFAKHNLPVMPLKGSILIAHYYPEPGLRPMADLDLLIHPADFAQSVALLNQLGYEQTVTHWKHTEFSRPDNRAVAYTGGEHPDNPRGIELHLQCRETFGGPTIDLTGRMWQGATLTNLLGESTYLPSPEALWLHLVIHACYHIWQGRGRLIHLHDLRLLTPRIDAPGELLQTLDARYTFPALALTQHYFPGVVETELTDALARQVSARFGGWVDRLDLVNTSYLNPKPEGAYFLKALRFSEGRPREMLQAARFAFLPSLTEIALDHPRLAQSRLPWLAYLLLPLDWSKRVWKRSA